MKKKITIIFLLGFCAIRSEDGDDIQSDSSGYVINVPPIADGTPFGINGPQVKKILYIIRKIEELLYGILEPGTKTRKKKYIFKGQPHSIVSLVALEREGQIHSDDKEEFDRLLRLVIEDFIKVTSPFIGQAQGVKNITVEFIVQWAKHHNREDSELMDWMNQEIGHEFDNLRIKIVSFKKLYQFCQDFISFLSDLIQSCPRGWKQFIELQQKNKK